MLAVGRYQHGSEPPTLSGHAFGPAVYHSGGAATVDATTGKPAGQAYDPPVLRYFALLIAVAVAIFCGSGVGLPRVALPRLNEAVSGRTVTPPNMTLKPGGWEVQEGVEGL